MPNPQEALFRALADPTRRTIFERLCREGAQSVGALTASAGVSQPAVTKHLGLLKQAGLVSFQRDGRRAIYRARADALAPLLDWTRRMTEFWNKSLDDLEGLLNRMDQ
jgi:DNA-binding transcriptional ArsR family regulator